MARKQQKGLSYFPFDVTFFDDNKIEMINAEFGIKGENITIRLLCMIYKNGYWERYDEDIALLIAKRVGNGVTSSLVNEVVSGLVRRSFFNKGVFDQFSILTSKGIQERFFEAIERRKKIELIPEIMLININATFDPKNVTFLPLNVTLMDENVTSGTQTKVKETKQKESKVDETIPATATETIDPKNEEKKEPPFSAPPPFESPEMLTVAKCHELYWSETYVMARQAIAASKGLDLGMLEEWSDAFDRFIVSGGSLGKNISDYARHFNFWLNKQNMNDNPRKLYEGITTEQSTTGNAPNLQSIHKKVSGMFGGTK